MGETGNRIGSMTAAERVKHIGRLITLCDIVDRVKGELPDSKENFYETINSAVALLLRDAPTAPIVEPYFYGNMYRCTLCGCYNVKPVDSYCPKCGQAIDWNGIADRS
jgi:rubrerythrin